MARPTNNHRSIDMPSESTTRINNRLMRWSLGVAAVLVVCLLGMVLLLIMVGTFGVLPLVLGMLLAVLPVPLYLAVTLWVDRFEREPVWMLFGAFLWGAAVATLFSLLFNRLNAALFTSLLGEQAGAFLVPVISAPIVEEVSKGLALFILYWWKKDEFDGVLDGIIYAGMVGLGFAMTENFLYYGRGFMFGGVEESLVIFGLRGVISPFIHPFFTAMTGVGLGLARQSSRVSVKLLAPVLGLLVAIFIHSLWNLLGTLLSGPVLDAFGLVGWYVLYVFLYAPLFLGVLILVAFALRRDARIVRHNLVSELNSGLLDKEEYEALCSVRGRLTYSLRAFRTGGFGGWRANSRFAQAASELAFHRDRVSRGITSDDDPAREAAYLQQTQNSKWSPTVKTTDARVAHE